MKNRTPPLVIFFGLLLAGALLDEIALSYVALGFAVGVFTAYFTLGWNGWLRR